MGSSRLISKNTCLFHHTALIPLFFGSFWIELSGTPYWGDATTHLPDPQPHTNMQYVMGQVIMSGLQGEKMTNCKRPGHGT